MEHVRAKGNSPEEFASLFKVKRNDVPRIIGKPIFTVVKPILDAVKVNLINMGDDRNLIWRKLHITENARLLPNGTALQVVPSVNQGMQVP